MREQEILTGFRTPLYCFDEDALLARARACREILSPVGLCYSIKANPFLVEAMSGEVSLLEVCSPGEFAICQRTGVAPEQILLSGVNKTGAHIRDAIAYGVRLFSCESPLQAALLEEGAAQAGVTLRVLLRLSAGSQFGMDRTDLVNLVDTREHFSHLHLCGLHYFSGTQRKRLKDQRGEVQMLSDFIDELRDAHAFAVESVEYGTGLYYPYFDNEDREDPLQLLRELAPELQALHKKAPVTVEMGRYLASECGTYLTTVEDVKVVKGQTYAIVDGGMHHLNYYGGSMGMRVPVMELSEGGEHAQGAPGPVMVCGSLCTTADVLVRAAPFGRIAPGDVIIFRHCGAYSVTEAPGLFLSRDLPRVLLLREGVLREARGAVPSWTLNTPGGAGN